MMKIKRFIFLLIVLLVVVCQVEAATTGDNIGSGGTVDSYCNSYTPQCFTNVMPGTGSRIQGVRVTVVDPQGNRVSKSIDIVNNARHTTNASELQAGTLAYNGRYGALYGFSDKKTRNEVIKLGAATGGPISNPTVYYWSALPDYINKGASSTIKSFLNSIYSKKPDDFKKIMEYLNYTIDFEHIELEKNYILVEPLMYARLHSGITKATKGVFYGTATEVYSMIVASPKTTATGSMWRTLYPKAIMVLNRTQDGRTYTDTAGLWSTQTLKTSNYNEYMLSNYGVASGHLWLRDIECGENCDNPIPCSTTPTVSFVNDCENGTTGSVSDTNDWTCIFRNINSAQNTYLGEFYHPNGATVSNKYCNVACREEISYDFSGSGLVVYAGSRFTIGQESDTVGNLSPVTVTGKSECRTAYRNETTDSTINWRQFVADYEAANAKVQEEWDKLQINIAKQKSIESAISGATSVTASGEHTCTSTSTITTNTNICGGREALYRWSVGNGVFMYGMECPKGRKCKSCINTVTTTVKDNQDNCKKFTHDGNRYWTVTTHYGDTIYYKGVGYRESYETSSDGQHINDPYESFDTSREAYNSAVAARNALLIDIRTCNNFQRSYSEFSPQVSFAYGEANYRSKYQLDAYGTPTSESRYFKNGSLYSTHVWGTTGYTTGGFLNETASGSNYGSTKTIASYSCSGDLTPCTSTTVVYPDNDYVIQDTVRSYDYRLPSNVYRYVNKDGISYNTAYAAELAGIAFSDIGYSNLPISYSTIEGKYNYYYEIYYMANGTPNLFGTSQKYYQFNPGKLFSPGGSTTYSGLTLSNKMKYHCTYYVDVKLPEDDPECKDDCCETNTCPTPCKGACCETDTCPTPCGYEPCSGGSKDLNLIYRTIDLDDPFPAQSGDGRTSGINWQGADTINGTYTSFIQAYITNNRGVNTNEVYNETPMYEFVLTSANIRAIRRYNNTQHNDYNDFTLSCTNGHYCKSSFLSDGLANGYFGYARENGGSCINANTSNWESCRYTHLGG